MSSIRLLNFQSGNGIDCSGFRPFYESQIVAQFHPKKRSRRDRNPFGFGRSDYGLFITVFPVLNFSEWNPVGFQHVKCDPFSPVQQHQMKKGNGTQKQVLSCRDFVGIVKVKVHVDGYVIRFTPVEFQRITLVDQESFGKNYGSTDEPLFCCSEIISIRSMLNFH